MNTATDLLCEISLAKTLSYITKNADSEDPCVKTAMKICIIKLGEEYLKALSLIDEAANVMTDAQRKLEILSESGFSDSSTTR